MQTCWNLLDEITPRKCSEMVTFVKADPELLPAVMSLSDVVRLRSSSAHDVVPVLPIV